MCGMLSSSASTSFQTGSFSASCCMLSNETLSFDPSDIVLPSKFSLGSLQRRLTSYSDNLQS